VPAHLNNAGHPAGLVGIPITQKIANRFGVANVRARISCRQLRRSHIEHSAFIKRRLQGQHCKRSCWVAIASQAGGFVDPTARALLQLTLLCALRIRLSRACFLLLQSLRFKLLAPVAHKGCLP
jgi:hypothetical protein